MNYCLITVTHDFTIENQKSGFNSSDTDYNSLYHAPVLSFYVMLHGEEHVFRKGPEGSQSRNPPAGISLFAYATHICSSSADLAVS